MANINKKCLIVDSSGVRPFVFAETKLGLSSGVLEKFFNYNSLDLRLGSTAINEFAFRYNPQESLFSVPLDPLSLGAPYKNISISLSDAGYFSLTNNNTDRFSIYALNAKVSNQSRLWELSPYWELLSSQDQAVISLAISASKTYDEVAILTNDKHLRQQCFNFEGISTYGSCSMLTGVVLTGFITYQKGMYIYQKWFEEEPRWIPYQKNEYGIKRKLKFGEVLAIERQRMRKGNSFWTP